MNKKAVISAPVKPLEGYVLIQKIQEKTYGGMVVKTTMGMGDIVGEVVAVGKPIEERDNGKIYLTYAPCKEGDIVIHKNLAGVTYGEYKLLHFEDIIGLLNE